MGMISEFRQFISRGNVVDLAVATVIGGAFNKITTSFVADVLMPPLGLLMGRGDYRTATWTIPWAPEGRPRAELHYGAFLATVIDFVIVGFAIFLLVKAINRAREFDFKKKEAAAPPAPTTKTCPECALDIPVKAKKCGHCLSALAA